jgi:cytochrome c biogenesis protein CcdA
MVALGGEAIARQLRTTGQLLLPSHTVLSALPTGFSPQRPTRRAAEFRSHFICNWLRSHTRSPHPLELQAAKVWKTGGCRGAAASPSRLSCDGNVAPVHAVVGLVAILMGLNLLNVLPFSFPSLDLDVRQLPIPPVATAYAAGLTFALAASPCSTPILATLLAYAATAESALVGATLLFTYSLGYIAPILVAATATVRAPPGIFALPWHVTCGAASQATRHSAYACVQESMSRVLSMRQYSAWLTPASGVLLLAGGTYAVLTRIF